LITGWDQEDPGVKARARELFDVYWAKVKDHKEAIAEYTAGDDAVNRAKVYAMMACLRRYRFTPEWKSWFIISHDGVPEYRFINEETIKVLQNIASAFYYQDELRRGVDDSARRWTLGLEHWDRIGFEFKRAVGARRHGMGFLPFINTGPEDLSRYGVYSSFDPGNYTENCLVHAFTESKQFTPEELSFLRSVVKVWRVPVKCLMIFANMFRCKIWVHMPDLKKPLFFGPSSRATGCSETVRNLNLYVRWNHAMLWDHGVHMKMTRASRFFREMTEKEINVAARGLTVPGVSGGPWASASVVDWKPADGVPRWKDVETFLTFKDLDPEAFPRFRDLMITRYGVDPMTCRTLAEFSDAFFDVALFQVTRLRGPVCDFIRECQKPPLLGTPFGECVDVSGDLVQVDRNGSYTSTYVGLEFVPKGDPMVIEDWPLVKNRTHTYYFVRINVTAFRSRHHSDPFPKLRGPGETFVDKTWLEAVEAHYDVKYEFVDGYEFALGPNRVGETALGLWRLRGELGDDPLQLYVKRVLNCLWGKTMWRGSPFHDEVVPADAGKRFIGTHPLLFSMRAVADGKIRMRMMKPVYMPFQRPQFGVTVLSHARVRMHELIHRILDEGNRVWYTNTDSLLVTRESLRLIPVGDGLGEFHVEDRVQRFICLSPKKYLKVRADGTLKNSFGKPSLEWFELRCANRALEEGDPSF
jgi:hypothetical protein